MKKEVTKILLITNIILILILCGCNNNAYVDNNNNWKVVHIEYDENNWDIYKSYENQEAIIVKNDKIKEKVKCDVEKFEPKIMELDTTELSNIELNDNNMYCDSVWNLNIKESTKYINQLKESEYLIKFQAYTQNFIEIYMSKQEGQFKRIIITEDKIIIADTSKINFKEIKDYLEEIK